MHSDSFLIGADALDYSSTPEDVTRLEGGDRGKSVIGQPRAIEAISMGMSIRARGYNIFVTGAPGTGRRTAVMRMLSDYRREPLALSDHVYVYNFRKPLAPCALRFEAGEARKFRSDVHSFVENVKKLLKMLLESEEYNRRRAAAVAEFEKEESDRLAAFEAELAANGFRVVQLSEGGGDAETDILPLSDGLPVGFEELQSRVSSGELPESDWDELRERYFSYMDRMKELFSELRRGRVDLETRLESFKDSLIKPLLRAESEFLAARHSGERVRLWIEDLAKDVENHVYLFASEGPEKAAKSSPLSRYGVNVLVDNGDAERVPVIFESHPTYANLFGSIEATAEGPGESRTAYLKIRPGALHHASGGFLVLRAEDVIEEETGWTALKRVMQTGRLEIQPPSGPFGPMGSGTKPEPADVDVKIVMIGGELLYDALYGSDQNFQKLFKISAEFDSTMNRDDETTREYIAFVRKIAREEGLREISTGGICRTIEYGVRLAGYRERLTTRFSLVADLLREADYHAGRRGSAVIDAEDVTLAERARSRLANLPEEKFADMIASGEILLQVEGAATGKVNGLAIHDRGYYAFGLPAVISAQVSPGESGVINIEGESGLSGEIYDKAVLIVEGFLRSRYARDIPLSVTASICFEQSYTAVEGDSASTTAVYALLSAIADVPLRQDIAVTGSMNQMGQVQPVGGVAEKVEGFFQICRRSGLTGTQGVMLPRQNLRHLTLSREVIEAVRAGKFSIYAVSSINEGLTVLTGADPGAHDKSGNFPPDSFNGRVRGELRRMAETIRTFLN